MIFRVFTDASIKVRNMGVGIYVPNIGMFSYRLTGLIDINRAELGAIYYSVLYGPTNVPLHVYTDSQVSIDMLYGSMKVHSKYTQLLESTLECLNSRKESVIFHKVKGHSGNKGNDIADRLARQGIYSTCILKLPDNKFYKIINNK